MKAEIITIGDELLIGQVIDTNSAWMAERLNEVGISLYQITSVHDNREHILKALDEAFSRADIVLTTGGLGPTKDDITKHVMCEYFGTTLVEDPRVREHIHELYKERPDVLNRLTATQWFVPESAKILTNRVGSAPIMVFDEFKVERLKFKVNETSEAVTSDSQLSTFNIQPPKFLVAMPGVPHEMKIAMTEQVIPYLQSKVKSQMSKVSDSQHLTLDIRPIIHRTILVHGIPESKLAILIEDWEKALPSSIHLAYLPKDGIIRLRLSSYGEATDAEIQSHVSEILVTDYEISSIEKCIEDVVNIYNSLFENIDDILKDYQ